MGGEAGQRGGRGRGRKGEGEAAASRALLVQLHVRLPWLGVTIWQRRHWKTICSISRRSLKKDHHTDHPVTFQTIGLTVPSL